MPDRYCKWNRLFEQKIKSMWILFKQNLICTARKVAGLCVLGLWTVCSSLSRRRLGETVSKVHGLKRRYKVHCFLHPQDIGYQLSLQSVLFFCTDKILDTNCQCRKQVHLHTKQFCFCLCVWVTPPDVPCYGPRMLATSSQTLFINFLVITLA